MKNAKTKAEIYIKFLSDYLEWTDHLGEESVDESKTGERQLPLWTWKWTFK